jgi:hypothetical protein
LFDGGGDVPGDGDDRSRNDSNNDDGNSSDSFSSECITCSFTGRKTATLLVESLQWNFYYCYRCGNWFQRHFRMKHVAIPVKDKRMVRALNWYYNSQVEALDNAPRVTEQVRKAWNKFRDLYSKFYEKFGEGFS